MGRQGRILMTDDQERWRDALCATLRRGGFRVDAAGSTAEMYEYLAKEFYHLLILDIRMEEADQDNVEGMQTLEELKRQGLDGAMEMIMLSAHGTREQMRESFRDYKVIDFIAKEDFDNLEFLDQVRRVFTDDVRINLTLAIHWQNISGPEQMVIGLKLGAERIKRSSPLLAQASAELDDLLCRLFHQSDSLLVRPLATGRSGAGVLWVQPFYASGGARVVVVKFGDFRLIEREYQNFKAHVQPFVGGGRNTTLLDLRRTPKLGGIVYSLMGADQLEDFGSFYRRSDLPAIKAALDDLFFGTCGAWYANKSRLQVCDLTKDYQDALGITDEKLAQALSDNRKLAQGKDGLHFSSLGDDRTFRNPVQASMGQRLVRSTYVCTTHGDFNEQNILVDANGHTWLIDFQNTGSSHILRDIAELDAVVHFWLLTEAEATIDERLRMEQTLCNIDHFSQVEQLMAQFSTENRALSKAYATSVHLRNIARRLVAQNPSDDISEYWIALMYNAMNTMRFFELHAIQREHALLCASLLAERLGL